MVMFFWGIIEEVDFFDDEDDDFVFYVKVFDFEDLDDDLIFF